MPEGNGEHQRRMDIEHRLDRLDNSYRALKHAFIVMTHLETRMSQMVRKHAEWLAEHDDLFKRAEKANAEMTIKMAEMNGKVDFLLNCEMRREGGPESR